MKELSIKTALNLTKNRKSAILSETNVEPQLPSDLAHNQAKIKQQSSNFASFHTSHKMMDCHCYLLLSHTGGTPFAVDRFLTTILGYNFRMGSYWRCDFGQLSCENSTTGNKLSHHTVTALLVLQNSLVHELGRRGNGEERTVISLNLMYMIFQPTINNWLLHT